MPLQYMKVIYLKLSNNHRDKAPAGYLSPPNELSYTENGFHFIEFLDKGVPLEAPTIPGYFQGY